MAVPSFVACLVLLSIFCSCCCQSPKALSVLLIVNVIGEIAMATYLFTIRTKSSELGGHFRSHLLSAMEKLCTAPVGTGGSITFEATKVDAKYYDSYNIISTCWNVHQTSVQQCARINSTFLSPVNYSTCSRLIQVYQNSVASGPFRQQQPTTHQAPGERVTTSSFKPTRNSMMQMAHTLGTCMHELEVKITWLHMTYKNATFSTLFVGALLHLVLALVVCVCDNRRKSALKMLASEHQGRAGLVKAEIITNDGAKRFYDDVQEHSTVVASCYTKPSMCGGIERGEECQGRDSLDEFVNSSSSRQELYLIEHNTSV